MQIPKLLLASLMLSTPAFADDLDAACRIPFEKPMDYKTNSPFSTESAINANSSLSQNLRGRYIVADLNSADESGQCKGVEEYFAPTEELSEFSHLKHFSDLSGISVQTLSEMNSAGVADALRQNVANKSADDVREAAGILRDQASELAAELNDWRNFQSSVERFRTTPISKAPVVSGSDHGAPTNFCVGQTLNYCEIVNGKPKLMYRFITSSSKAIVPSHQYYAPINTINTRHWSSDRKYGAEDAARDAKLGGGDGRAIPFANGGRPIEMPNFLNFVPMSGYPGETQNGIHEIAGGLDSGGTFGAPVSLGCLRLNDFQSKLSRWWIPLQAKLFIYYTDKQYRRSGNPATGHAG